MDLKSPRDFGDRGLLVGVRNCVELGICVAAAIHRNSGTGDEIRSR